MGSPVVARSQPPTARIRQPAASAARFSFIAPLGRIPDGRGQFRTMPLFEYECRGCGIRFEELVRGSAAVVCPRCSGEDVVKLLSRFAVGSAPGERSAAPAEPGPCGACGAPVRGSCAVE
ncbi:MAG TPA: zinc ribbon domain-containing protein [Candidatus Binatia bacterium]|nr:zinc ribbon domain-containing protein [Candidatus Binatia bacterium]